MTSPFAKRISGGDYLKAADHVNDLAIILEPKKVLKDQPHEIDGIKGIRDVAIADVTCFRNSEDVESGVPSLILKDVQITNQILVADVERNDWLGKVALVTIEKAKRAFVYRDVVFPGAEAAAIAFYDKRNADIAANLDAAPSDFE